MNESTAARVAGNLGRHVLKYLDERDAARALLAEVALAAGYTGDSDRGLVEHVAAIHGAALLDRRCLDSAEHLLRVRVDELEAIERHARDFAESDPMDGLREEWQYGFRTLLAALDS